MTKEELEYRVGTLLYMPALYANIVEKIRTGRFWSVDSLAFCLEDSIQDSSLDKAEEVMFHSFRDINRTVRKQSAPLLFVRVRGPLHMKHIHTALGQDAGLLTGYILPKFDEANADDYVRLVHEMNAGAAETVFVMPILETERVACAETRRDALGSIKRRIDSMEEYVLNIRCGGNDFCNIFGIRRSINQTIYEIGVIRDILVDILNYFSCSYVVSAPVCEFFETGTSDAWKDILRKETQLDRLNGFIGKTAIHPSQIPVIAECMKVSKVDYTDALQILNWNDLDLGVARGENGRMNEVKVHGVWARKILRLAEVYGVEECLPHQICTPIR
ncbi:MAG: HpcH/HpaI aldolase/citrate lyase family protein [Treponema sp.]|jgi:citrate lyase beta subunit|nr:HpcH/HpaI aldolase/citrate lyase family protein [Treponema sp.]